MNLRVKICGITSLDDALAALDAGADALGLNFFAGSKRYLDPQRAAQIAHAVPQVARVGVFVNAPPDEVAHLARQLRLDAVQLHGDETPETLAEVVALLGPPTRASAHPPAPPPDAQRSAHPESAGPAQPHIRDNSAHPADPDVRRARPAVIRALPTSAGGLPPIVDYVERCRRLGCLPDWLLLDAQHGGAYGGTGHTADWDLAAAYAQLAARSAASQHWPSLILAGGLTPQNVALAIETVRPAAVDTASGVESGPGRKDAALLRAFVQQARTAFAALAPA